MQGLVQEIGIKHIVLIPFALAIGFGFIKEMSREWAIKTTDITAEEAKEVE